MRFAFLGLVVLVACTKRNPNVCCETDTECAAVGYDSPQPCDVGVCVANTCADTGCDGNEDCLDPAAPVCEAGACVSGISACEAAGGRIAFVSNRDGDDDVLVMNASGDVPIAVTVSAAFEFAPQWSPTGDALAFTREVAGAGVELFVSDDRGDNATSLSAGTGVVRSFAWSNDGQRLAYEALASTVSVYLIGRDGSGRVVVPDVQSPRWSPDGTKILFLADMGATRVLGTIASDGQTGFTNLVSVMSPSSLESPRWSPDGTKIAFVQRDQGSGDVFVIDASGANHRNLTNSNEDETEVAWQPDGAAILFVQVRAGDHDIWTMTPSGEDLTNLTNNPARDQHPAYSPDGTSIVFETERDGNTELYRMPAQGGVATRLTRDDASDRSPTWGPCH